MSADLFAAFGEASPDNRATTGLISTEHVTLATLISSTQQWEDASHPPVSQPINGGDDEDFGDFEGENPWKDAESGNTNAFDDPVPWTGGLDTASDITFPAQNLDLNSDADVLFDAEEPILEPEVEDGDFGDFEDFTPAAKPVLRVTKQPPVDVQLNDHDLLGFTEPTPPASKPPAATKPRLHPVTKTERPTPPPTITSATESWDDFPVTSPASPPATSAEPPSSSLPTTILSSMTLSSPSPSPLQPPNIPPPSILLPLLPLILSEISATLLQPLLSLAPSERTPHLLSPGMHTFLLAHQSLTNVLVHLVAGRKLRWRRDKRLAASMSISAAGGKGMKLAGVDRGEQAREEAQVAEVVKAWRAHVGPLRAAVGAVNALVSAPAAARGGFAGLAELVADERRTVLAAVPDLAGTMPVRTATVAEGAVVGTVACGLCGLKREERVAKVDVDVLDSFGEWWVEKTNLHLACWRFWEGFKDRLGQR